MPRVSPVAIGRAVHVIEKIRFVLYLLLEFYLTASVREFDFTATMIENLHHKVQEKSQQFCILPCELSGIF